MTTFSHVLSEDEESRIYDQAFDTFSLLQGDCPTSKLRSVPFKPPTEQL